MTSVPPPLSDNICATVGCEKRVTSCGFCVSCYYRLLRRGDLTSGAQTTRKKHRLSKIDIIARTALCAECGTVKIISGGSGRWRCSTDMRGRARLYQTAYREARKRMMSDSCEICGSPDDLRYDHCHVSELFRGTLCNNCNIGLGLFCDDPTRLRDAAAYVEQKRNAASS